MYQVRSLGITGDRILFYKISYCNTSIMGSCDYHFTMAMEGKTHSVVKVCKLSHRREV